MPPQRASRSPSSLYISKMCYDKTSKLCVRTMGHGLPPEEVINAEGTRQGDPLAGAFVSLFQFGVPTHPAC
jgi:hypothetical protein